MAEGSGLRREVMQLIDMASLHKVGYVKGIALTEQPRTSWQEASIGSQAVVEVRDGLGWQRRTEAAGPKEYKVCRRWTTTMHGAKGEPATAGGARWSVMQFGKPESTGEGEVGLEGEGPVLTVGPQVGLAQAVEDDSPASKRLRSR